MKHSEDFIQEFTSRLTVATMNSKDNNVQSQAYEDSYIHEQQRQYYIISDMKTVTSMNSKDNIIQLDI